MKPSDKIRYRQLYVNGDISGGEYLRSVMRKKRSDLRGDVSIFLSKTFPAAPFVLASMIVWMIATILWVSSLHEDHIKGFLCLIIMTLHTPLLLNALELDEEWRDESH